MPVKLAATMLLAAATLVFQPRFFESMMASAIRLIESGRVPLMTMHTHDFPLEEAERAIRTLAGEIAGESSIHSCLLLE